MQLPPIYLLSALSHRPHVIISALSMHLPPVLWAWIRAPATHFLGARILTTLPLSIPPAAFSALPQHLPSPLLCNYTVLPVPLSTGPYLGRLKQYGINCLAQGQTKCPRPGIKPATYCLLVRHPNN